MHNIILPALGEGIERATVARWHFKIGDRVGEDDDVVEVVTDKAVFCVAAGCSGKLKEIRVGEGACALIGETLGYIEP